MFAVGKQSCATDAADEIVRRSAISSRRERTAIEQEAAAIPRELGGRRQTSRTCADDHHIEAPHVLSMLHAGAVIEDAKDRGPRYIKKVADSTHIQ